MEIPPVESAETAARVQIIADTKRLKKSDFILDESQGLFDIVRAFVSFGALMLGFLTSLHLRATLSFAQFSKVRRHTNKQDTWCLIFE